MTSFSVTPKRRELPQYSPTELAAFTEGRGDFQLVVNELALNGIRKQAGSSPVREVGGVLVGRHFISGDKYLVHIQDCVPVPSDSRGAIHFEFDESSVLAILTHLDSRPDQYVVGWYHSHISGVPFMSELDDRLHSAHFTKPWYVSCVVSAGSWGRVAGFWRMVDDDLREVNEYSVVMSAITDSAEAHTQFIAACGVPDPAEHAFSPRLLSLLPDIGVDEDGALGDVLAAAADSITERDTLGDATFLIRAALAASAEPAALAELRRLEERIGGLRLFADVATPVMVSPLLKEDFAVSPTECYTYTVGTPGMIRIGLTDAWVLPIKFPAALQCVAHEPSGIGWVLTRRGRLGRLPALTKDQFGAGEHRIPEVTVSLPDLGGEAQQMVVVDGSLWLLSTESWHHFALESREEDVVLTERGSGPRPAQNCLFVSGNGFVASTAPPSLLANDGGVLRVFEWFQDDWRQIKERGLPRPWASSPLRQAARSGSGWYLMFEHDEESHMLLLDADTLEVTYRLVGMAEHSQLGHLSAIGGDGHGRVFARAGGVLYRV